MKIGKYTIQFPIFRESMKSLEAEASKSWFHTPSTPVYKPDKINDYYEAYLNHDLIRGMVDDLAESASGQGFYTTIENVKYDAEGKPLEDPAKKGCDHFCQFHNLDSLLPNITKNTLIAGFCPVETQLVKQVEKTALKIIHPKTIKEIIMSEKENGVIEKIIQQVGQNKVNIEGTNLAWFTYGQIGNDVRGTSYVRSMLNLLNILEKSTANVDAILDRYIAPKGIWKSRRSMAAIKQAVEAANVGEDIFLGELSDDEVKEKIVEFIQIDPRVPFWEFIEYLNQRIYGYSRSSNLWFTRNAVQASADKMEDIVRRHVNAIQRNVKRGVEKYWFAPLVALNKDAWKEVPKLNFGTEPTGVEDIQIADFLTSGLEVGYINQKQYYDILNQMGVKIKAETEETPGSATPPAEPTEEKVKEALQIQRFTDSWACPRCGYFLLHPMTSIEFIECPKCGFKPSTDIVDFKSLSRKLDSLLDLLKKRGD